MGDNRDLQFENPPVGSDAVRSKDSTGQIGRFLQEYLEARSRNNRPSPLQAPGDGDGLYDSDANPIDADSADPDQPLFEVTRQPDGRILVNFFPTLSARESGETSPAHAVLCTTDNGAQALEIYDQQQRRFSSTVFVDPETGQVTSECEQHLGGGLNAQQRIVLNTDGTGTYTLTRCQNTSPTNGNGVGSAAPTDRPTAATFVGTFRSDGTINSMNVIPGMYATGMQITLDPENFPLISESLTEFLGRVDVERQELLLLPPASTTLSTVAFVSEGDDTSGDTIQTALQDQTTEDPTSLESAARGGDQEALRTLATMARKVRENTPESHPNRLALASLINIATSSDVGSAGASRLLLRLADGSQWLNDQVWRGVSARVPQNPQALRLLSALSTGAISVPSTISEALAPLARIVREGNRRNGERAATTLLIASGLGSDNQAATAQSSSALQELINGCRGPNDASRQIFQRLLEGAVSTGDLLTLNLVTRNMTSEPLRRQFVDVARTHLREAPQGDSTRQRELASALTAIVSGCRPLRIREQSGRVENTAATYLGEPSEELLARARGGDSRARLEIEAYGIEAIRILNHREPVDRQIFANIAAVELSRNAFLREIGIQPIPRRTEQNTLDLWNDLLSRFVRPSELLFTPQSSNAELLNLQLDTQTHLVNALRQRAAGDTADGSAAALIELLTPERPLQLLMTAASRDLERRENALRDAARIALLSLILSPERETTALNGLINRLNTQPGNTAVLRTTLEFASRMENLPADNRAALTSHLSRALQLYGPRGNNPPEISQALINVLSGAAAFVRAGHAVESSFAIVGRSVAGSLIQQFNNSSTSDSTRNQRTANLIALTPFLSADQVRTLLQSREAASIGIVGLFNPNPTRIADSINITPEQQALRDRFSELVRGLLSSREPEVQTAALRYIADNFYIVGDPASPGYQVLIDRIQALHGSTNAAVRDGTSAALSRALEFNPDLRSRMLASRDNREFQRLAVEAIFRAGAAGLATTPENASILLSLAQDASGRDSVRRLARALLLPMVAPDGLPDGSSVRAQVVNTLRGIARGSDSSAIQNLVNDAIFLSNGSARSNDAIAGLTAVANSSSLAGERIAEALLDSYSTNCPVQSSLAHPDKTRLAVISRALCGIDGASIGTANRPSILERAVSDSNSARRDAALTALSHIATSDATDGTTDTSGAGAEQALSDLLRNRPQTLNDLTRLATGRGIEANAVLGAMVRIALRPGDSNRVAELRRQVEEIARQPLAGAGQLAASTTEVLRLLQQAGQSGNTRAIEMLGLVSASTAPAARNAYQALLHDFANRPANDPAGQLARSYFSNPTPERSVIISQALAAALREMTPTLQDRVLADRDLRSIAERLTIQELTANFRGDSATLRTIAGMIDRRGSAFSTTDGAISALCREARNGSHDATSVLIAAASRSEDADVRRQAVIALAEVAGITLSAADRESPDHGLRACLELVQARALSGARGSISVLIQTAADPLLAGELRTSSMNALREVLSSTHSDTAVTRILSAWHNNPSPTNLAVLAAASAQLPDRRDLQQQLQSGYLEIIRRDPGQNGAEHRLRSQSAAMALLANPQALSPAVIREIARHLTPQMAELLVRTENIPQDRVLQLLASLRELAQNPPQGTDLAAVARAFGAFGRVATAEDVEALTRLRERANSTEAHEAIDRGIFSIITSARDRNVRSSAMEAFRTSTSWSQLTEPMRRALTSFATTGSANLSELRNAFDRVIADRAPYPLAISIAMSMNVITWELTTPPLSTPGNYNTTGGTTDQEICRIADQIMDRVEYGDSRTLSGWVLPLLSAAYDQYGGSDRQTPSRNMILAVMQNLGAEGRLTDPRFQDLDTADRDAYVQRWQNHRSNTIDQINATIQEMRLTGASLVEINQHHQRMLDAYHSGFQLRPNDRLGPPPTPPPLPPRPSEDQMRAEQRFVIRHHEALIQRLEQLHRQLGESDVSLNQAHNLRTPAEYFELRSQGRHDEARLLLIQRWAEGSLPPALNGEFQRTWQELHQRGLMPSATPPTTAAQGYQLLAAMSQPNYTWMPTGEQDLRRALGNALMERSLQLVRHGEFNPANQQRLEAVSQQFQARSQALINVFSAAIAQGRPDAQLANFVSTELTRLQTLLNNPETIDLRTNLGTAIRSMSAELERMPQGSVGRERLRMQISAFETLHTGLDPNGEFVRNLRTVQQSLRDITPDTPTQQLLSTIAHVAIATATFAAAAAFVTATFGTGAVAIAAGLVLTPLALTATSQITTQGLYWAGGTNRSTPFMDWVFNQTHWDGRSFVPVTAGQAFTNLGEQFAQEAIMNAITMGAGSLGRAAMGRVMSGAGYAIPHVVPPTGAWSQRFSSTFWGNYTRSAHVIGMGLAAPSIVNEDVAHAMAVIGPLFAFGHSAFETARHARRVATPERPSISRPAELIDHLNLTGLNDTQKTQMREWWAMRTPAEQRRIAEAFRFINPSEDVRVVEALRRATPQQLTHLMEAIRAHVNNGGSAGHSGNFLREFGNLPQAERTQLLELCDGLRPAQRNLLVARLAESALHAVGTPESPSQTGQPMPRLVRDILGAGNNRAALIEHINQLPPSVVSDIAGLSAQQHRLRALETLATSGRGATLQPILESLRPPRLRTEFLRSLAMIEDGGLRGQALDRIAGHRNGADLTAAIASMTTNRSRVMEFLGGASEAHVHALFDTISAAGDRNSRASMLLALSRLTTAEQQAHALEAVGAGGRELYRRMSGLSDVQLGQALQLITSPGEAGAQMRTLVGRLNATEMQQLTTYMESTRGQSRTIALEVIRMIADGAPIPIATLSDIQGRHLSRLRDVARERMSLNTRIGTMDAGPQRDALTLARDLLDRALAAPNRDTVIPGRETVGDSNTSHLLEARAVSRLLSDQGILNNPADLQRARIIAEAWRDGAPIETTQLNDVRGARLVRLSNLVTRRSGLTAQLADPNQISLPGMTAEQLRGLRTAVDRILSGREAGQPQRISDMETVLSQIANPSVSRESANALANILSLSASMPADFPAGLRSLARLTNTPESTAALRTYEHLLRQINSQMATSGGNGDMMVRYSSTIMRQLQAGVPGLEGEWVFVPAAPPLRSNTQISDADLFGVDGVFINLTNGSVRPVDFSGNAAESGVCRWHVGPQEQLETGHSTHDPAAFLRRFLNTTADGVTRPSTFNIFDANFVQNVGLPSFAREPLTAQTIHSRQERLNQYIDRLHTEIRRLRDSGQPVPPQYEYWAQALQETRGGYNVLAQGSEFLMNQAARGSVNHTRLTRATQDNATGVRMLEFALAESIPTSYIRSNPDGSGQHVVGGSIESFRVYSDGRIEVTSTRDHSDPRPMRGRPVGTVLDVLQGALTSEQARLTPSAATIQRLQADIQTMQASGGQLDFTNQQHRDLIGRLVGYRYPTAGNAPGGNTGSGVTPTNGARSAPRPAPGSGGSDTQPSNTNRPSPIEQPRNPLGDTMMSIGESPVRLATIAQPADGETVTIGRHEQFGEQLRDPIISRRHVEITNSNGELTLTVLGQNRVFVRSANGTITQVTSPRVLQQGDEVILSRNNAPRLVLRDGAIDLLPPRTDQGPPPRRHFFGLGIMSLPRPGDISIGSHATFGTELAGFESVSPNHVRISRNAEGAVTVTSLDSSRGTYISRPDGAVIQVTDSHTVQPGEHILLSRNGPRLVVAGSILELHQPQPRAIRPGSNIDFSRLDLPSLPENHIPSLPAVLQSNRYQQLNELRGPIEHGFQNAGQRVQLDDIGALVRPSGERAQVRRAVTVYDPARDPVLRAVLAEARGRFDHLRNDPLRLMEALSQYTNELLHPQGWNQEALNCWYDEFNHTHAGQRVLLGEFLRRGTGVCSQQALLVHGLAQSMGINPVMVRNTTHAWNEITINGTRYIFDPRNRVYGQVVTPETRLRMYTPGVQELPR
ncbi:MAG: FHA domain-containing protein [Candidatus Obscuribacterales bacterium]|nr:FHA domain-containing protein [Candidatus Obscuribacterales bacterium]